MTKRELDPQRPGFLVKDATKKALGDKKKKDKKKAARKARRKNRK